MIILSVSPLHISVETVICRTALILISQSLLGRLLSLAVHFNNPLCSKIYISVNKHFQAICIVLQNIIRTTTDNYARLFFCKLCDDFILIFPQNILICRSEYLIRKSIREKAAGCVFSCLFYIIGCKARFFNYFLNDFCIIARNFELFCNLLPIVRPPLPNSRLMVITLFFICSALLSYSILYMFSR